MFERFKRTTTRAATGSGTGAVSAGAADRAGAARRAARPRGDRRARPRRGRRTAGRFTRGDERTFAATRPRSGRRPGRRGPGRRAPDRRRAGRPPGHHGRGARAPARALRRPQLGQRLLRLPERARARVDPGRRPDAAPAWPSDLFDRATGSDASSGDAKTIGLGGGIALLLVLALAWYAGGYVAGRMARFDGARQGVGVWLWTLLVGAALAILGAIGGSQYDVFGGLNLPSVPVNGNTLTGARRRRRRRGAGRHAARGGPRRQGGGALPSQGRPRRAARPAPDDGYGRRGASRTRRSAANAGPSASCSPAKAGRSSA